MRTNFYAKTISVLLFYLLFSRCSDKDRLINYPYDNNLVGDWKVTQLQVDSLPNGSPNQDFVVSFKENSNEVSYSYSGVKGVGHYFILSVGYGIAIKLEAKDVEPDEWLGHFIANLNQAKSYQIIKGANNETRTLIRTNDGGRIVLLKV